jgi:hypothetical protein
VSEVSDTGRPGRYQRSFGGLIGSMIVLVLVVLGIVVFRGAFRNTPSYDPEPVDYEAVVTSLQQGWFAKDVWFERGDRPQFDLALMTSDEHFAGLHEEDESVEALVDTLVGTDATRGDTVTIDSEVAPRWQTFSDPGGDHAFAAEVDGQTVLVYGSAPEEELRTLVESLTTDRLRA